MVRAGRTSLTMHVGLTDENTGALSAEGYTTFVTVDPRDARPVPHGICLDETDDSEVLRWRREAEAFFDR